MIYQIKRNNTIVFKHEINGVRTETNPAIDFVDIEFDYYKPIHLESRDELTIEKTYYLDKNFFSIEKISTHLYKHRARFVANTYHLTNIIMLHDDKQIFEIEGNLNILLSLAVENANRSSQETWTFFPPPNTVTKLFQISNENVMSFLVRVSGEFNVPFQILGNSIRFGEPIPGGEYEMTYGKGNGFLDLKKSYKSEKAPNVVYASGADGLMLGSPIVDGLDIVKNGVIEGPYTNENIKPTTQGQMSGVVTANNVVTSTLPYNINDFKVRGQTPIINFETGHLGGYSFFIDNVEIVNGISVIYIRRRVVEGGVQLPNNDLRPLNGDFFNITNITQPPIVVDEAINKLYDEALKYMEDGIFNNLNVEATVDPLNGNNLFIGNRIKIEDADLQLDDYFIINEIRTDLQNYQKKQIVLNHLGNSLPRFSLPVKNDNILNLEIGTNRDDIVKIEEEVKKIDNDLQNTKIDFVGEVVSINKNLDTKVPIKGDVKIEGVKSFDLPIKIPEGKNRDEAVNVGQLAPYVLQNSLNTQLQAYVSINGIQTINNTKTFTSSPIVPSATLNNHAVNFEQLNTRANLRLSNVPFDLSLQEKNDFKAKFDIEDAINNLGEVYNIVDNSDLIVGKYNQTFLLSNGAFEAYVTDVEYDALKDGATINVIGQKDASITLFFNNFRVYLKSGDLSLYIENGEKLFVDKNESLKLTFSRENNGYFAEKKQVYNNWLNI